MDAALASDEVTDQIAFIEMHRQERQKEAGLSIACNEALQKLNQLLADEKAALHAQDAGHGQRADIEAIMRHIQRVISFMSGGNNQRKPGHRRSQQQRAARPGDMRNPAPNKGRRAQGRRGDR
jgi:ABC-type sugar transport system ATPase subunit